LSISDPCTGLLSDNSLGAAHNSKNNATCAAGPMKSIL
jgi:hypothetical protein